LEYLSEKDIASPSDLVGYLSVNAEKMETQILGMILGIESFQDKDQSLLLAKVKDVYSEIMCLFGRVDNSTLY